MTSNKIFYTLKPFLPRSLQLALRRRIIRKRLAVHRHVWPIDEAAGKPPENWNGWPEKKQFALVLSHDVDTQRGHDNVMKLAELEMDLGFRSSFNFVPERYKLSRKLIDKLWSLNFEVCVHGLNHDGKLFWNKKIFSERAVRINEYIKNWGSVGFTSPSMHHNLEWMHLLDIEHGTSTFDTDPFEPQPDGCGTIFPYFVPGLDNKKGYVELPYTLPQDFTLFILMGDKDSRVWEKKVSWIASKGGMAFLNSHTDYMSFNNVDQTLETYSTKIYTEFLELIKKRYEGQYWLTLPSKVAQFYREFTESHKNLQNHVHGSK